MTVRQGWRALIYNRASHDPAGQAVSVESQNVENQAWCDRESWTVVAVVTDNDRSATRFATKEREGFREIRDGLADGRWGRVDVLVTWASSRNQRRLDGYVELREQCVRHGMRLAYKGRVYDLTVGADRFQTGLDALLDERDAEEIRDGILRSHRASVAAGRPRGSIPYGYTRTYLPGQRRVSQQVPDPETAPVVKRIVRDVLAGRSLYEIAKALGVEGVATPQQMRDRRRGRQVERAGWSSTMVRNLLRKPSLAGIRTHRGVPAGEGVWEPLVGVEDWRAVQAVLGDPARRTFRGGREPRWLLSGVATCGVCGAWLRPLRNKGRMTYRCEGVTPTSPRAHVSRDALLLDAWVTSIVVDWLADPGLLADVAARELAVADRGAELRVELAELRARLAQAETAVVAASAGTAQEAMARIVVAVAAQIDEREAELSRVLPVSPLVAGVAGPDAAARWAGLSVGERRELVRGLGRVVVWPVGVRGRRGFDPSTVQVIRR